MDKNDKNVTEFLVFAYQRLNEKRIRFICREGDRLFPWEFLESDLFFRIIENREKPELRLVFIKKEGVNQKEIWLTGHIMEIRDLFKGTGFQLTRSSLDR